MGDADITIGNMTSYSRVTYGYDSFNGILEVVMEDSRKIVWKYNVEALRHEAEENDGLASSDCENVRTYNHYEVVVIIMCIKKIKRILGKR